MGILRITVDHTVRITATSARVHALVRGSSTFSGDLTGKKSALVREIVADLAARGVGEDAIDVAGVRLGTREGKLLNTQSIEISLVVAAAPELLPGVLGALSDRAGVSVEQVEWVYDEFEASIPATATAMTMARRKADAVAMAAGVEITGISDASDSWSMPGPRPMMAQADMMYAAAPRARHEPLDLGLEINTTTDLCVHLSVDFALSS
jgi:hypothetical protein